MVKSLKFLADDLIVSPDSERRQLTLSHPDAAPLRDRDIVLASICELKTECDVFRSDPAVHILIFSLEGSGVLVTDDTPKKGVEIEPGSLVVLPAHHKHHYSLTNNRWKALWFYLANSETWLQLRHVKPHIRISLTQKELYAAMEGFWSESLRNESRARLAARYYAELLALNLERELELDESPSNNQMRQKLYQLWDTVSGNLSGKWSVEALADEIGISPQHLYRISMRFCGRKPMEMVTRIRMQQAQELLISTSHQVKAIAAHLGYADSFSFSTAFKRYSGLSPREFRNRRRITINNDEPKTKTKGD